MKPLPTICFLTGTLNAFAGAERMTAVIANALAERGYPVLILSLWDARSCFTLHPDVVHETLFAQRPSFKRAYLSTVGGIRRFVKQRHVDVLIEVDTMLTLFTLPATLGLNVRRIAWEHCHFDEDLGNPLRRYARRMAARWNEAVVVLTERDRKRWLQATHASAPVIAISNPLPFAFPTEPAALTSRIVLAVGRLTPVKGFDVLLQAWELASRNMPGWKLRIVGEGEARGQLEAMRHRLGLDSSVDMPGATKDIEGVYRDAAMFCLSSRYEGYGLALVEAMAYGLPIVSTNCETGPREILQAGTNGMVVAVDDATAMAQAIVTLASEHEVKLRERLAANGRQRASRQTIQHICSKWEQILGRQP